MTDLTDSDGTSRRGFLRAMSAVGATGVVGTVAGCGSPASRRYEAAPIALDEAAGKLGYHLDDAGTWERTESAEALGMEMDATLVNKYTAYRSRETNLGFVATPAVEEAGRTLNPLADRPLADIIDSEEARSLLEQVDVGQEGDVNWQRGPERLEGTEVQFLDGSAEAAAVSGVTAEEETVLLNVARARHQGDVVFGVQAYVPTTEEAQPSQPLSGNSWNLGKWWDDFEDRLDHGERIDPCQGGGTRWVEITEPSNPPGYIYLDGRDGDGNKLPVEVEGGYPHVEITVEADTGKAPGLCNTLPGDFDHYEWSIRRTSGQSHCGYPKNKWTSLGTGGSKTIELHDCRCSFTGYDIRVQGIDSNGNVASTDTIKYYVNLWGC